MFEISNARQLRDYLDKLDTSKRSPEEVKSDILRYINTSWLKDGGRCRTFTSAECKELFNANMSEVWRGFFDLGFEVRENYERVEGYLWWKKTIPAHLCVFVPW